MHHTPNDDLWTEQRAAEKRARLARLNDSELEKEIEAGEFMWSPRVPLGRRTGRGLQGSATAGNRREIETGERTFLIQTLRILARSHRRFTEEQKTKVFRSIVKEARLTATGVELEMYVQPTQNVWWKYRHKKPSASRSTKSAVQSIRINLPSVAHHRDAL